MQPNLFSDHYEALQLSHNADPDTIHRVYRILAQRYHPDNRDTGNSDTFRMLIDAYQVLSDPEKRAAYDVRHREERRVHWQVFDQSTAFQGVNAEKRKREGVLSLLYRKRVLKPDQPGVTLKDLEDLLGVPKEHLEFALWYLKENQSIQRSDNGRYVITLQGAESAEAIMDDKVGSVPLLASASRVA